MNTIITPTTCALLMTLTISLIACNEDEGMIWGGAYQCAERPGSLGAGHWLDVDMGRKRVTLTDTNAEILELDYEVRPSSEWPLACSTNHGSTDLETFDLKVESIEIDGVIIGRPYLTAGCFREDLLLEGDCTSGDFCVDREIVSIFFTSMYL